MWSRTRDPRVPGANEQILRDDLARLEAWLKGEPVLGGHWKLCYTVENFAPACQLVVIEQRRPDGTWEVRQSCHTIEFQGRAAARRGGLVREHAAPVTWNGDLGYLPELRVAVRGVGQVRVGRFELRGARVAGGGGGGGRPPAPPGPRPSPRIPDSGG